MESVAFIQWCLDHLNYWTITLLMTIESSFIPFPSEVVVPPAAFRAAETGEMSLVLVVVFATLGANLGAIINYLLARYLGRPIVYRFANSRLGHLCLIDETKVKKAEKYFDDHGAVSTFVGRLVPAVRQLISIPAGLARMKLTTFLFYTTLGACVWNSLLAAAGWYLQQHVSEEELMGHVMHYSAELKIVCIAIGICVVAYLAYKSMKKPDATTH
ncbi:MAG: DedA family protein [Clostridium sp.]|nr:DedA family protein [Clostridium sp.]